MFSTPLICCSIGVTTVAATTSALAPGYCPDTVMVGGAISGYCATGRRQNATPPTITKIIETTEAKIGRSMKKCDIRMGASARYFACGSAPSADAIITADALLDDAQIVGRQLAQRDVFDAGGVLIIHHGHKPAGLLGTDGNV